MRTKNAANYALLEDKVAELVEKRLEDIRHDKEIVYYFLQCTIPIIFTMAIFLIAL